MPVVLRAVDGKKALFDEVSNSPYFKGIDMATIYVLAAAYGQKTSMRERIVGSEWVTRQEFITRNTQLLRLCQAIAVSSEGNINILLEEDKLFSIIEEYASAGINELRNRVCAEGEANYDIQLQRELKLILNENK